MKHYQPHNYNDSKWLSQFGFVIYLTLHRNSDIIQKTGYLPRRYQNIEKGWYMAFRFRRSIRIAPGLRINLGKRGVSLSAGGRGATITTGARGTYANVGIPGSGLSYRERIGGGSEQRRTTRTQQRLDSESKRLEKERIRQEALSKIKLSLDKETGALQIENAFGAPLSRQDLKLVWDQKKDMILEWLEQQADATNGDVELLTTIHEDTPSPDSEPEYNIEPFNQQPPEHPKEPDEVPKPSAQILPDLGFFASFSKSKITAHEEKQQQINSAHTKAMRAWVEERRKLHENYQVALEKYTNAKQEWDNHKKEYETNEVKRREEFPNLLRTNTDVMNKTLEDALNSLSWPRETLVSYQITDNGRQAWIDVDLPEIELLPIKQASVASSGKKLNIKDKTAKQLQLEYALHIHGIAFRLAGTIFATLPTVNTAIISGFSQRLDSSTGKTNDEYLLSIRVEREQYTKINFDSLDKVNPIDAMGAFEIRRKLTSTGVFKAIDPFEP